MCKLLLILCFTAGEDYELPPNQYLKGIAHAGRDTESLDIRIFDDNKIEGSETFRATIFDLSLPSNIKFGHITNAIVTIQDDDGKHMYLHACVVKL